MVHISIFPFVWNKNNFPMNCWEDFFWLFSFFLAYQKHNFIFPSIFFPLLSFFTNWSVTQPLLQNVNDPTFKFYLFINNLCLVQENFD